MKAKSTQTQMLLLASKLMQAAATSGYNTSVSLDTKEDGRCSVSLFIHHGKDLVNAFMLNDFYSNQFNNLLVSEIQDAMITECSHEDFEEIAKKYNLMVDFEEPLN